MELNIYNKEGKPKATVSPADSSSLSEGLMTDSTLSLSFVLFDRLALDVNDYIDFLGKRYWMLEAYTPNQKSTIEWSYSIKLYGIEGVLRRALCLKTVGNELNPVFSLTDSAIEHIRLVVANINRVMGVTDWKVGEVEATANLTIDYNGTYCNAALSSIATAAETEWWIDGLTVNLCRCEHGELLELGYENGLKEITLDTNENAKFFTRLFPLGSSRNIDASKYGSGRLHLPGGVKYVEQNTQYGVIEHSEEAAFADIYPKRVGVVGVVRKETKTGENGKPFDIYYFTDPEIDFDPNAYEIGGLVKSIVFETGDLAGRDFEVNYNATAHEFEVVTQFPYDDEMQLPGALVMKPTDQYILYNITMPTEYYPAAEQRFSDAVSAYMEKNKRDKSVYKAPTDYIDLSERGIDLTVGQRVRLLSDKYFPVAGYRDSRISKITRKVTETLQADIEISDLADLGGKATLTQGISEAKHYAQAAMAGLPDMIKSWENTPASDSNLHSSKKTNKEIRNQAVSRQYDDSMEGHLTCKGGLLVKSPLTSRQLKSVISVALMEEGDPEVMSLDLMEEGDGNPDVMSTALMEDASGDGATTFGGLTNVGNAADEVSEKDVVAVKPAGEKEWVMKEDAFLPTGTAGDGTEIKTFDTLMAYISRLAPPGVQRNLRVNNELESRNVSASKGEPCLLQFTFISQERYSFNEPYEDTGERGLCEISLKNTDNADFTVIKEVYIPSGFMYSFDCSEYLTSGANNIMIKVKGEITGETTPAFVYTVQLTSLSLSANNFPWWTAYASDFNIPLNIGGNVSKTLYVTLSGEGYRESYQVVVGTGIYTETAYNYLVKHPTRTGVFNLSCYVSNSDGTIKTRTLSFNVICVVSGAQTKLIAINNVLLKATNWSENNLFDYAMYDGDNVNTSAEFLIQKDGVKVFGSEEDTITTATKHSFSFPMEIDTIDNSDFNIDISVMDGTQSLITPITVPVGNKAGYSAVAGATFYLNPRTRSNRQTNHKSIINEMDGSELAGQWQNMTWGNDGWTTDVDGNNVLRLMAGSMLTIPYKPFSKECARTGKTLEWDYKIDNVTDYTEPVITVSVPSGDSFIGLNIYADDIIMHTSALKNTTVQSIGTDTSVRIRMSLVVQYMAYGNNGFNLCFFCINGKKVRTFAYANNDYFAQEGEIVIGSDFADVDLYGLRIYENGLTTGAVLQNYINWLTDNDEKARVKLANDILDSNGVEIEYENAKDQYNVFVFDNTFPSFPNQANKTGTLELFFIDNPERNVKITNVTASGHGTSSKKYWEWNEKFKLDKNLSIVTYTDGTTAKKKFRMFDGVPACASATAKKNWASSMQDHKCGSVNAYTDVAKECGLTNEAIDQDAEVRLSVAQKPFFGFSKSINEEGETVYLCMGEFTFGPDKGDKYCFGYDDEKFPKLISIEGSDNAPLPALYRVPWTTARMVYNPDEEAWQYNGTNCFDFGAGLEENIKYWIPAYNCAYQCSGRILPFNGTIDQLNAQVADYKNSGYEYWTNDYNLYYYEAAEGKYIASDIGVGIINLKTQLVDKGYGLLSADLSGKTKEQLNALFIAAREKKFFIDAPSYWDVDDTLFHDNWVELFAGTDQRAKNTYPYSFGGKWKWRIDDADTIGPVDNQGQLTKGYSIETHDKTSTGAAIWNGETSVLHNLFETAFAARKVEMMRIMLSAMGDLGGLSSGTAYDKLYAFYQKYFLSVKEYFPHNAVNADARRYENAKLAYMAGIYTNDTDPITQSLGDGYSTETAWFKKRFLYIMSKYSFGTFSADGTDSIIVRAAGDTIQYEITPAIDMYPGIANGTSIVRGTRTKAGEKCIMNIELGGSGDQQNALQCASYLMDIGEWYNKNVRGTMTIKGRMLRYIRLGSKTHPILISISALTIADCASLQDLILSNITTLAGVLNLTECSHLRKVYADGTSLTQIQLPRGGALTVVEFSAYNQYLSLANYPLLTNEGVGIDLCKGVITDFFVVDCPKMQPMKLLSEIIDAQVGQANHALKRVRAVGFDETYHSSDILDKLATLADGSYIGLSSDGLAGEDELPVLDGRLNVFANAYEQSIEALRNTFKKLVLNHTGKLYIKFEDPLVEQLLVSKYDTEKDGYLTKQEAESAPYLYGTLFENKSITSFEEFGKYFSNIETIGIYAFKNSTIERITFPANLKFIDINAFQNTKIREVHLPDSVQELKGGVFRGCTLLKELTARGISATLADAFCDCSSLTDVIIKGTYTIAGGDAFRGCTSLANVEIADSVLIIDSYCFQGCAFKEFIVPSKLQELGNNAFDSCKQLKSISLPNSMVKLGWNAFRNCSSLATVEIKSVTPPSLNGSVVFIGTHSDLKIYVPDTSVNNYKTATNWSVYASRIYPLSSKPSES